jgi:hypothetical protein
MMSISWGSAVGAIPPHRPHLSILGPAGSLTVRYAAQPSHDGHAHLSQLHALPHEQCAVSVCIEVRAPVAQAQCAHVQDEQRQEAFVALIVAIVVACMAHLEVFGVGGPTTRPVRAPAGRLAAPPAVVVEPYDTATTRPSIERRG